MSESRFIMLSKRLSKIFLILVIVFGFAVSFSVTVTTGYDVDEPNAHDIICEETQLERLDEIFRGEVIEAFSSDGKPVHIPSVNFILPPGYFDYFYIGVDDVPTPECIDFILSYTGIPRERAHIVRGRLIFGGDGGCDGTIVFPPAEHITYPLDVVPFTSVEIGRSIVIVRPDGDGALATLGHPIDSSGSRFATSFHSTGWNGNAVYAYGTFIRIGTVENSYLDPHRDVAIINLDFPYIMSANVLDRPITNFRTSPRVGDNVYSFRGVSGMQPLQNPSQVVSVRARVSRNIDPRGIGITDKIAISPAGVGVRGDSGAALIRMNSTTDRAVLGTHFGVYTDDNLRQFGIYTNVMNYYANIITKEFIVGDLDGDGQVTSADATLLARWLAGHNVTIHDMRTANITCTPGTPTITDLIRLARWLVGHYNDHCPNGIGCSVC